MDTESGDPYDGASPAVSPPPESDSYDDILGVQGPIEDFDFSMHDFEGDVDQLLHTPPIANMVSWDVRNRDATLERQGPGSAIMELSNPDAIPMNMGPNAATDPGTIEPVAQQHEDLFATKPDSPSAIMSRNPPSHVSESGASGKIVIKEENEEDPFEWTSMPEVISISDDDDNGDDDIMILQPDGSSVPIKKEDDEVEFLWADMGNGVIDLDADAEPSASSKINLGKSFLKGLNPKARRSIIDRSAARRAQDAYLREHRRKHGIPETSANPGTLNGLGLQGPKRSDIAVDDSGSDWMNAGYIPDEDTGKKFRALKKSYNAKVKNESNTIEDDIEFAKAEKAENLRLARLKAEYDDARGYSDDDDSDNGLFVSPSPPRNSRSKRRIAEGPGPEDETLGSRGPKQRKPNSNGKRSQQDLEEEQEINMVAGIEDVLHRFSGKKDKGKSTGKAKKSGSKRTKRKPGQAGYLNGSNGLLASNIYEDADANLHREALPVSGHTHKQKALAALVASVPLGMTEKDAVAEKNQIMKATVTLGRGLRGACKADGEDNWKLPGMKSSLRHHQVLASAWMKERETGGEEPLGGILVSLSSLCHPKDEKLIPDNLKADAMGMGKSTKIIAVTIHLCSLFLVGKTVETIALMISNPPPRSEKHRATLIVCTPGLLIQCKFGLDSLQLTLV